MKLNYKRADQLTDKEEEKIIMLKANYGLTNLVLSERFETSLPTISRLINRHKKTLKE